MVTRYSASEALSFGDAHLQLDHGYQLIEILSQSVFKGIPLCLALPVSLNLANTYIRYRL